ncbi:hypothetical protein PHLCEN_2v7847, partial [Hermanssonia centrifuga]
YLYTTRTGKITWSPIPTESSSSGLSDRNSPIGTSSQPTSVADSVPPKPPSSTNY